MSNVTRAAKIVLADSFKFYLKAHNYHWNVEGMFFQSLHELFSGIYNEVWPQLDIIAEHIRAMDDYAPGSWDRFNRLSTIQDENETGAIPAKIMLQRLYDDNQIVLKNIKECFDAATAVGNEALADLMAGRQEAHAKHGWMLRATLKNASIN